MTDIMKLADKYAEGSAEMREILNSEVGTNETDQAIERMTQQARAAEALVRWQHPVTVREGQANHWQEIAQAAQADRDALQAKLDELQRQEPVAWTQGSNAWKDWPDDSREAFRAMEASK